MIYKYENLKTKAQIDVNISKKYSFIYGPNGTGKTTFARSIDNNKEIIVDGIKKKHLVFSQDFVNNNIYISTSDSGYKSDTKNRSRLKQIFLGNTSKEDNETLNTLRTKKREYNKELIQPDIFKSEFKNIVRELLKEDKEYNEDYEKFIMNYVDDKFLKKYTEKLQNIMENEKIEVDITKIDDEEYISKLELPEIKKTYTEEEVKEELINFLKETYNKQEKSINKRIDSLNKKVLENINEKILTDKINSFKKIINSLEEKKKEYEIILKLQKEEETFLNATLQGTNIEMKNVGAWINEGHKYHKPINFSKCLYCRNEISEEIKESYTTMLKNSYIASLNDYTQELKSIVDIITTIEQEFNLINKEAWYSITKRKEEEKIIRIIIKKVNRIKKLYKKEYTSKNYYKDIIKDLEKAKVFYQKIKDSLKILIKEDMDTEDVKVKAYQLYLNSNELKNQLKKTLIKNEIIKKEKKLSDKIKKDTQEYIKKIEKYIGTFEGIYEPRIKLNIKSNLSKADNAETTIELMSDEKDFLNNLSEGEKNVLALTIFFSYVKNTIEHLKENEKVVIILDDPVNSNDWNNFFKFQAIIEDYFYNDVMEGKIDNIIILSHNIDYAIIQLQNDKYTKHFELLRLFSNKCEKINTEFIFMDDIKLGSKLIHKLLENMEIEDNICYVDKKKLYRVAIYMRKFLETFINSTISISDPKLEAKNEENIKFLKDNINSDATKNLLEMSTNIIKDTKKGIYTVNEYMQKFIDSMYDIISNYKLFKDDAQLNNIISNLYKYKKEFYIRDDLGHKITANTFKIDYSSEYEQILIDTMIKGLITQIKVDYNQNEIECTKKKAERNFLNYLRHVNDNVGRPVLAVNSDKIIDNSN